VLRVVLAGQVLGVGGVGGLAGVEGDGVLLGDGVVGAAEGVFVGLAVDAGQVLLGGLFGRDVAFCGGALAGVLLGGVGGWAGLGVWCLEGERHVDVDVGVGSGCWASEREEFEDGS